MVLIYNESTLSQILFTKISAIFIIYLFFDLIQRQLLIFTKNLELFTQQNSTKLLKSNQSLSDEVNSSGYFRDVKRLMLVRYKFLPDTDYSIRNKSISCLDFPVTHGCYIRCFSLAALPTKSIKRPIFLFIPSVSEPEVCAFITVQLFGL